MIHKIKFRGVMQRGHVILTPCFLSPTLCWQRVNTWTKRKFNMKLSSVPKYNSWIISCEAIGLLIQSFFIGKSKIFYSTNGCVAWRLHFVVHLGHARNYCFILKMKSKWTSAGHLGEKKTKHCVFLILVMENSPSPVCLRNIWNSLLLVCFWEQVREGLIW